MLNFGIVGVGRMGMQHAMNIYQGHLEDATLTAICDSDLDVLKWCEQNLPNSKRYKSVEEMLNNEKLDGVIIATPHPSHTEIAKLCIEKGINTLIEKPLTITTKDAKDIIDFSKKYPNVKVGVSYNQRTNQMYIKAKQLLEDGTLGEIQRVNFIITNWFRSQAYYNQGGWRASYKGEGGGCLINQCIHQLDILQYLVGMPKSIYALSGTIDREIKTENDVTAILDYGNYKCLFSASTHELDGTNRLEIACDKGRIVINDLTMDIYLHESEKLVNKETKNGYGDVKSIVSSYSYGDERLKEDKLYGQQLRSLRCFKDDILNKGKMLASVDEGLNAVMLINAIYLSSWKEQVISLPINDDEYLKELNKQIQKENK